jgi:hypothetical protein
MQTFITRWIGVVSSAAILGFCPLLQGAARPSQELTNPTVAEMAAAFAKPPAEYGAIHWALGFPPPADRILSDIDRVSANGGSGYMINSGGKQPKYLSQEYFDLMTIAVQELKKRGMKMWIDGDDGYPDGLAGGMISKDYPQLGMQGIVADTHYTVAAGQTLSIPLPDDTLGILANTRPETAAAPAAGGKEIPIPADGKLTWLGPSGGNWEVVVRSPAGEGRYSVVAGQTLSITLPPGTSSVQANAMVGGRGGRGGAGRAPAGQGSTIIPVPADGRFSWTAPATGNWEVTFVRHVFRSSPTRYGQREDGTRDKDSLYSLIDYLNPEATATYIKLVEETYVKHFPTEMGTTILGFRGDETDYTGFSPWTPKLLETFKAQKGYDLQPHIAEMFATPITADGRRVKADYWDVWSGMFRDNFYKPMEDWCRAHNMDYMLHLNHEETMLSAFGGEGMVTNEGSFWRDMRYIGVPGVDNLNQIGMGIVADFPKIAGSAAHLYGRPQAWSEEGGNPGSAGKYVFDYQMIRGLNYMNIRGLNVAAPAAGSVLQDPAYAMGWYVSRSQYVMAMGKPAAQVALYHPTDSYWLGDLDADAVDVKLTTELMEHQVDFDHIDQDSVASICTLDGGGLKNLSGQVYRAVIVPSSSVIEKSVLDRLRAFAAAGGKVIFVGRTPTMVADQSFLNPEAGAPDLSFATLEPTAEITDRVIAALPSPDVKLDAACPAIKYLHRTIKDGEIYFFLNESPQSQARTATITGTGDVQMWDAATGQIHPLAGVARANGSVSLPLALGPAEARIIVIGPLPGNATGAFPGALGAPALATLDGNWSVTLGAGPIDTPLKSWRELGAQTFGGIADYRKSFDLPTLAPAGQHMYIDLGEVKEVAKIRVNGTDFDARSWPPYVWDVTDAIKSGTNTVEVQVQVPPDQGGRGGGAPPARGGAGGARGGGAGGRGAAGGGDGAGGAVGAGGAGRAGGGPATQPGAAAPVANGSAGLLGPVRIIAQ